jgi:hypothetical protein
MLSEVQKLIKEGKIDQAIELAETEYSKSKDDKLFNLYGIALFKKENLKKLPKSLKNFTKIPRKPEPLPQLFAFANGSR